MNCLQIIYSYKNYFLLFTFISMFPKIIRTFRIYGAASKYVFINKSEH